MPRSQRALLAAAVIAVAAAGFYIWWRDARDRLPDYIVSGNGRIEAVEIDVAAKAAGRVAEISADEGDFVTAGQILARMDTATLDAQLREAKAQAERAVIGIRTAESLVSQRQAELEAAQAVVLQRKAELAASRNQAARTKELAAKGNASEQKLDEDRARFEGGRAALSAAEAQVAAAQAAIGHATSQVIAARAEEEAARATVQRIQADIDDARLTSPRDGRVQYRVAQAGEVVAAGGAVLNLVDLTDVYMTFFLPTASAGRLALGAEARIVLDAAPQYVIPAKVSFVADVAQFTPKTVETAEERQKLIFRVKVRIDPALLKKHLHQVKTGLPGVAYVRLDQAAAWPPALQVRLPQ